jgi:hypothetical protein
MLFQREVKAVTEKIPPLKKKDQGGSKSFSLCHMLHLLNELQFQEMRLTSGPFYDTGINSEETIYARAV